MAKRGRPKKNQESATVAAVIDHAKLLKQFEQEQQVQLKRFYKDLAKIKRKVDLALSHIINMETCDTLSEAVFKAGRAHGPIDEANDQLEEILDEIYGSNDFDHYEDLEN